MLERYKAKGTKMKGGKSVPNCVKEDEFHHQKDKDGNTIPHEDEIKEGRVFMTTSTQERGESPAKLAIKDTLLKMHLKKQQRLLRKK